MIKLPYVADYSLFSRIEYQRAEELLHEYNDFYESNLVLVQENLADGGDNFETAASAETAEEHKKAAAERLEHNQKVAADHFAKIFGSTDFAESSLVGLKINWYDIQEILSDEYKAKLPIMESQTNAIAEVLGSFASLLLHAERIVSGLEKLVVDIAGMTESEQNKTRAANEKAELAIEFAKEGFTLLLERMEKESLIMPEYNKNKAAFKKVKTVEAYIDMCEKLFFQK